MIMEQFTQYLNILSISEWLLFSIVVVLLVSLFSFKNQRKQYLDQQLSMQSLQRDLRALANAAVGVGGRVLEIERNQRKTTSITRMQQPTTSAAYSTTPISTELFNSTASSQSQPYEQAIRMAQTGASIDDIVNVCGLSASEAELVNMMHRLDKAS